MKKKVKKVIKMKPITKVLMTIVFLIVGLFIYHYSQVWGEDGTKIGAILCVFSWTYLFFVQTVFLHLIWE